MRTCVITAASNMSDGTFEYLCDNIRIQFGSDISFTRVTDDRVIGGFCMELDGTVHDLTLATQLDMVKKTMIYEEGQV